jgi:hypothetical protein
MVKGLGYKGSESCCRYLQRCVQCSAQAFRKRINDGAGLQVQFPDVWVCVLCVKKVERATPQPQMIVPAISSSTRLISWEGV